MNHFKKICTLILLSFALSVSANQGKIKVGVILRLSDNFNVFVQSIKEGIDFAHKKSTISKRVEILFYDHNGTFQSINSVIERMKKDNVRIILGAETSSDALMISRLTKKNKIPFITPTASSHKMFEFNENTFRISHDDKNVYKTVKYILKKLEVKKINIYHNISKPNTNYIANSIKKYLNEIKFEYVSKEFLSDTNVSDEDLNPFYESNSNVICLFAFQNDLRKVFEFFKNKKRPMIYLGADGWGTNKSVYEKYIVGMDNKDLFTGIRLMYWNKTRSDAFFKNTVKVLGRTYGKDVNEFHSIGFDAMSIVLQALQNVSGEFSNKKFVKRMKGTKFKNLLTTEAFTFDETNAPMKDMYLYKIDKQGIKYWGVVSP